MQRTKRFNLPPAKILPKKDEVIDLGSIDLEYEGWLIVVNGHAPRSAYTYAINMEDGTNKEKWDAMGEYIKQFVLEWNFVIEDEATHESREIPQPYEEGGVEECPFDVYPAMFKAIVEAIKPPNA